jgi:DNA-binding HxlR family transcriptional regulator
MPRLNQQNEACSVARALQRAGDRWTPFIICDAFCGVSRSEDFQQGIGAAKDRLADRLAKRVDGGLLEVGPVSDGGWVSCQLIGMGRELPPTIMALLQWGDHWVKAASRIPVRSVDRAKGEPVTPLQMRDPQGQALEMERPAIAPGPVPGHPDGQRQSAAHACACARGREQ